MKAGRLFLCAAGLIVLLAVILSLSCTTNKPKVAVLPGGKTAAPAEAFVSPQTPLDKPAPSIPVIKERAEKEIGVVSAPALQKKVIPALPAQALPKAQPPAVIEKGAAEKKGPAADSAIVTQGLPSFQPVHNYTGPVPLESDKAGSQELQQNIPDFSLPEAVPSDTAPSNNPPVKAKVEEPPATKFGGPQSPSGAETKKLPSFRPVVNQTGPVAPSEEK